MPVIAAKILVGFVVGVLIGLTGVGGGVLLLPVLIFGLGYSPSWQSVPTRYFNSSPKFRPDCCT